MTEIKGTSKLDCDTVIKMWAKAGFLYAKKQKSSSGSFDLMFINFSSSGYKIMKDKLFCLIKLLSTCYEQNVVI